MTKKDFYAGLIAGVFIALFLALIVGSLSQESGILRLLNENRYALVCISFGLVCVGSGIGMIIGKKIPLIYEAVKFIVVGGLNTLVDFGVLNLLLASSGVSSGGLYSLFKGISFVVAVANSYVWNKFWTFSSSEKTNAEKIVKFFLVSGVGFGINVGIASVIVNTISPLFGLSPQLWANAAALIATAASMVWNFVGYKVFVFHSLTSPKKGI